MTDVRTLPHLRTANRWHTLHAALLTVLILLTIPTTVVSCFAIYYGFKAYTAIQEFGEKMKKSNADMEAEIKKANADLKVKK